MSYNWFKKTDINFKNNKIITLNNLHGYVLPHASTTYTGNIISHTLRFKPTKIINQVLIVYYPSSDTENIIIGKDKYYHEYYVPWQSFLCALNYWKINTNITFIPINIKEINNKNISLQNFTNSIIIISSDFSHYKPFKQAIESENKAAHALIYKNTKPLFMNNIVDDPKSYKFLFKHIPNNFTLQWVGRTRSPGKEAVGYLSFLLTTQHNITKNINGLFVTCYDSKMNHRECLGQWFDINNKYSKKKEVDLINKVINLGQNESRLTNGEFINIPVVYYSISYLYKSKINKFIRGWHTLLANATYLSDVFLENTFNNGKWFDFKTDYEWPQDNNFIMTETLKKLNIKANLNPDSKINNIELYDTFVKNVSICDNQPNNKSCKNKKQIFNNKTRKN